MNHTYCGCIPVGIYNITYAQLRMDVGTETTTSVSLMRIDIDKDMNYVYQTILLLDQLDNLLSDDFVHSKRRMQRIQPKILVH